MFRLLNEFYRSKEWLALRALLLLERVNEHGDIICEHCGGVIVRGIDTIAHHIIPVTTSNMNDMTVSLNPENIMLVHHHCHNVLHNRFGLYKPQRVFIVHGAPLAGKTSFVRTNKDVNDIVLDLDMLYTAITLDEVYNKNNLLSTNVFMLRDSLLDQIKMRSGKWETAWVVGMYPLQADRERLADRLGAEVIYVPCTKEESLQRLHHDEARRPFIEKWEKYIDDYFIRYQPDVA